MTELTLPGCRTTPLGSYLASLGLLRAVTRLLDSEATGRWQRQRFALTSRFSTIDELVDELLARFEPEAIVSPWSEGAGLVRKSSNRTAAEAVEAIRRSTDARLGRLREAIAAGDRVVALGLERGWGGSGNDLWDKNRKRDILGLCRNEFPDHALPWLDTVVALGGHDDLAFSRLLGTGGNFGRQDLSATYLARLQSVCTDDRSRAWLHALLSGEESTPYLRDAVGQFDPGRAGGIQSSPLEKADDKGFVNPWAFLLTVEGALLFATAVVRRHGAGYSRIALPFQVRSSAVGYPTQAPGENVLAELWAPEWSAPARLDEVTHLLAEGRAEWNDRPAGSGLDFARAVATLGVDRGIDAFERHLFVDRHGQNPLAVPAGRITVEPRPGVRLLAGLDRWLEQLHRAELPSQVSARLRAVEQALFNHAQTGDGERLADVIAAVGRCHEAVARSGSARRATRPLLIPGGPALLDELRRTAGEDVELQLALALATARDREPRLPLRVLLSPVSLSSVSLSPAAGVTWTDRPPLAPLSGGTAAALAEAARRRGFPGAVKETNTDLVPAVKGVRIGFERGVRVPTSSVQQFVTGGVDDERLAALLAGLLTIDWRGTSDIEFPGRHRRPDPVLDLVLPFTCTGPIRLPDEVLLRPGSDWPGQLRAGHTAQVVGDAARRLQIAGWRYVISPGVISPGVISPGVISPGVISPGVTPHDGSRLAAVLLLRVPDGDRLAALRRVAVRPESDNEPDKEIPA